MKQVTVIIKPGSYDDVMSALRSFGVRGLTVTRIFGSGRGPRGAREVLAPHTRLDILATDSDAADVVRVVAAIAGHGIVYVTRVDRITRVRTGESGVPAL
jgi:nitrogen regulatory protein P-II 1